MFSLKMFLADFNSWLFLKSYSKAFIDVNTGTVLPFFYCDIGGVQLFEKRPFMFLRTILRIMQRILNAADIYDVFMYFINIYITCITKKYDDFSIN